MDGLLRSEFALVLRDSLNSTPRRHVMSPPPPSMPSPPKKPRVSGADFGIHCDMQLEPRIQFAPIPTSPTSPLPTSKIIESSTVPSSKAELASPSQFGLFNTRDSPLVDRSPISKTRRHNPVDIFTAHRKQLSSSPTAATSLPTRPLDVLAAVSLEQSIRPDVRLSNTERAANTLLVPNLPSSPVNSEPLTPVASDEKKKAKARGCGKSSTAGRVFSCKMCTSTFSQQFNLNKHVRAVHERRRPFECETCHARFQQKSHRTMHHLAVHEKLRQFACDQCTASFSWRGVLKKHRKSIHGIDE